MQTKSKADWRILWVVMLLLIIGVVMVYSASWPTAIQESKDQFYYGKRQLIFASIGLGVALFVSLFDYHLYQRFAVILYGLSLLVGLLVFSPIGTNQDTFAYRWIRLGPLEFMPSDLIKVGGVIMISKLLCMKDKVKNHFTKGFLPVVGLILLTVTPVLLQPDFSTSIVIAAAMGCVYFFSGMDGRYFLLALPLGGVAGVLLLSGEKNAYRLERIRSFLNPLEDYLDTGWQLSQALFAVSSGGLLGLGIGQGRQKIHYLSQAHNDFIFAVIAEELGFVGSVFVIGLYMLLIFRGLEIAVNAADKFGTYLASGITVLIGAQSLINIGVSFGAIPPTGVTLPFLSYGGTSILITMGMIGILLNISKMSRRRGEDHEGNRERRRDRRTYLSGDRNH